MRPTSAILGASRIPLTPKRGNKDFYKGTRQAYAPGNGHRTGPPGKHVVNGKAKYRIVDEQVRVFVGPPKDGLFNTDLKPYVSTTHPRLIKDPDSSRILPSLPSFSPNATASPSRPSLGPAAYRAFSKAYARTSTEDKAALIQAQRRKWWDAMVGQYQRKDVDESETRRVEEGAGVGMGRVEGSAATIDARP